MEKSGHRLSTAAGHGLADLVPDLIAVLLPVRDASGAVVDVEVLEANAAAHAYPGGGPVNLAGRRASDFLQAPAAAALIGRVAAAVASGRAAEHVVRTHTTDGSMPAIRERIAPLAGGRLLYLARPVGDLEAGEASTVLAALPFGVLTLCGGRVRSVNPAAAGILGGTPQELMGRVLEDVGCAAADGAPLAARLAGAAGRSAVAVRRPDGRVVGIEAEAVSLGGGVVAVALWDVTGRVELERGLWSATRGMRALLDLTPDPVARLDLDGRVLQANPAALALIGLSAEAVQGRQLGEIEGPTAGICAALGREAAAAAAAGVEAEATHALETPGGRRWLHVRVAPEGDEAGPTGHLVLVARDVTRTHRDMLEQSALRRVATAVAGGVDAESAFALIASEAARVLGAEVCAVMQFLPGRRGRLVGQWAAAGVRFPPAGTLLPLDLDSESMRRIRDGQPARYDAYDSCSGASPGALGGLTFGSAIGHPVRSGRDIWGVVGLTHRDPGRFTAADEDRLARFAALAGVVVSSARPGRPEPGWNADDLPLLAHLVRTGRLSDRAADLLTLRFGLDGAPPMDLATAAGELRMQPVEARRELMRALRRLSAAMLRAVAADPAGGDQPGGPSL